MGQHWMSCRTKAGIRQHVSVRGKYCISCLSDAAWRCIWHRQPHHYGSPVNLRNRSICRVDEALPACSKLWPQGWHWAGRTAVLPHGRGEDGDGEVLVTAPTSPPDRRAAAQASTHTPGCPWAQGALGGPHPQLRGSHPVAPISTYWAGHRTKGAPKWFRRAGLLAGTVGLGAALGVSLVRWQQGEKDANRDYYWISKKKKTPNLPTWKFIKIFHLT